ncbi:hypothetical protein LMG31506_04845 [Cupriavidus yeoncheonensis]|uniref:H-NS histone family protein n=1 Tax=Cupriavidus yeoncheonensis TaxID=1462994 RepID=A0A916IYQ6_9BURK|nr:H-NS histone family protein [Cupriavidus yeoncheonensis]CAG2153561.1 hypothetical protein LMG31506_04845 [Cupriavidus yeoncheonensis]
MDLQYPALKTRLLLLDAAIQRAWLRERKRAIEEILHLLASVGLEPRDMPQLLQENAGSIKHPLMLDARKQTALRIKRSPQFIDPATGRSWNGLGKRPKWLTGNIERFRVVGF